MGKQVSAIRFTGTVGQLVGSKGVDGKIILREKAASVANPQTDDQMAQRARLKLAAQVAGMLSEVGKLALKANGYKMGRRGILNKDLLENITVVDQVAQMPRILNLVKNPEPVSIAQNVTVAVNLDHNTFTGGFNENMPDGIVTAKALMVYDRVNDQWVKNSVLDTNKTIAITVENAANCDAYFYAEMVIPTTSEGKARLAKMIGETPGYKVAVNRLDSSNYGISRTFNAGIINGASYTDHIVADPNAIERERQEAVEAMLNTIIEGVGMQRAINIGLQFAAANDGISVNKEFIKLNEANVTGTPLTINYEELAISKGNLTIMALGEVSYATPLTVSVPVDDNYLDPEYNSADDHLYLVVYNKTNGESMMSDGDGTATRSSESVSVSVPGYWQGSFVEVYAFLLAADGASASKTIYCGAGRIA